MYTEDARIEGCVESRAICRIRGYVTVGVFRQIDSRRLKQEMMTLESRVNDGKK